MTVQVPGRAAKVNEVHRHTHLTIRSKSSCAATATWNCRSSTGRHAPHRVGRYVPHADMQSQSIAPLQASLRREDGLARRLPFGKAKFSCKVAACPSTNKWNSRQCSEFVAEPERVVARRERVVAWRPSFCMLPFFSLAAAFSRVRRPNV